MQVMQAEGSRVWGGGGYVGGGFRPDPHMLPTNYGTENTTYVPTLPSSQPCQISLCGAGLHLYARIMMVVVLFFPRPRQLA